MENDEKSLGDKRPGEDDLLDFEFEELADDKDGVEAAENPGDGDIIELVDVVEKGEVPPLSGMEITDEEGLVPPDILEPVEDENQDGIDPEDHVAVSDVDEVALEEDEDQDLSLDLESVLEGLNGSKDGGDAGETVSTLPLEEEGEGHEEEPEILSGETEENPETEPPESEMVLPSEDLSVIPDDDEGTLEGLGSVEEKGFEPGTTISEEKLEEIVERVVGEAVRESVKAAVESTAREVMTEVAEKLITEAIDALRESLDPST